MLPLLGGLLTGGASLLGSIFSSNTSAANTQAQIAAQQQMQTESMLFNRQEAETNRGFQASQLGIQREYETQMSNTAYQRASADMKAAGLNPMMMFGSGGAASTPSTGAASGSAASVGTPTVPMPQTTHPLAGLGAAVGQGIQAMVTGKTVDKMSEEIANLQAENANIRARTATEEKRPAYVEATTETERKRPAYVSAQTATEEKRPAQVEAQTATERERPELVSAEAKRALGEALLKKLMVPGAEFSARAAKQKGEAIPDETMKLLEGGSYIGGKISDALAPILSTARSLRRYVPF